MALPYTLYWAPDTGAFAIHAILEEVGADYRLIRSTRQVTDRAAFGFDAPNPLRQVPVLVLPDGTHMTESAAMVLHLAAAFPDARLMPDAARPAGAVALRWLLFLAVNTYTALLRVHYRGRFVAEATAADAQVAKAREDLDEWLGIVEEALDPGPYLLGQTYTASDLYLAMVAPWHPDPNWQTRFPRIAQVKDAVHARAAVQTILAEHGRG